MTQSFDSTNMRSIICIYKTGECFITRLAMENWLNENCKGKWRIGRYYLFFENADDKEFFKEYWGPFRDPTIEPE